VLWLKQGPFIHSSKAIMPRARQQLIYLAGDLKNAEAAAAAGEKRCAQTNHTAQWESGDGVQTHTPTDATSFLRRPK